jgi:4-alpha-glucanotransferase
MITQKKQELDRGAGILMPISALPSPYGIGTLGKESYRFADFLKRIGCRYWQVLPVGPTSFGDSPYQSFSAFAGNPYFIDLDYLAEEGLLKKEEITYYIWQKSEDSIDYESLYQKRFLILKKAFERSSHKNTKAYQDFCIENKYWLEDYSLYMSVKSHFDNREWSLWDEDIRSRKEEAVMHYSKLLDSETDFWKFCQYKFREQWDKLKAYVNSKHIQIIGDIPLYVALDSSDVWVHGDLFELDERKNPIHVAGVPPDAFSEYGQRWGNPIYRWDIMEANDFAWWRERMNISASLYDIIRIDHFIGVVNYYSIPVDCPTAVEGCWVEGPGKKLTEAINKSIGNARIIAEDLGVLTQKVRDLIEENGYPGMKILEFGMDDTVNSDYMPHNFKNSNCVAYIGTHDNETMVGYLNGRRREQLKSILGYFNVKRKKQLPYAVIRALFASIADVAIVQMQDILELNNKARMNYPSTIGGNWIWRLKKSQYGKVKEKRLKELIALYARTPKETPT